MRGGAIVRIWYGQLDINVQDKYELFFVYLHSYRLDKCQYDRRLQLGLTCLHMYTTYTDHLSSYRQSTKQVPYISGFT